MAVKNSSILSATMRSMRTCSSGIPLQEESGGVSSGVRGGGPSGERGEMVECEDHQVCADHQHLQAGRGRWAKWANTSTTYLTTPCKEVEGETEVEDESGADEREDCCVEEPSCESRWSAEKHCGKVQLEL